MNKKTKEIIRWSLLVVFAILAFFIVFNWDAFVEGFSQGMAP